MTGAAIRRFGDTGLLVEVPDAEDAQGALRSVMALRGQLERSRPPGVTDLVPAARTVLVRIDPHRMPVAVARAWLERELARAVVPAGEPGEFDARGALTPTVEIGIRYDGPDLDRTAGLLGILPHELVAAHQDAVWTVAFTGFAPGFGYLVSDDWPFDVPRLDAPRTRVPAGSVGLAGPFSGAYPRATPGGWQLIGTTSAPLFDPDAASPALLRPGLRVRFREERTGAARHEDAVAHREHGDERSAVLRVEAPGLLTTIQDSGRPGVASLGVSVSGALDRDALRTANRLVGNDENAAALEIGAGGFEATALEDTWIAVTGGWGALAIDGHAIDHAVAHAWRRGQRLRIGWFTAGLRAYLAVRGGIDATRVLGSASADTLAGIGPAPLRSGAVVGAGHAVVGEVPASDLAPWSPPAPQIEVRLVPGPRADAFTPASLAALFESPWTVGDAVDRVGMRLDGPRLDRLGAGELASEGMVPGAIQVPPSGLPTILLADGPVTGGYPVIATVVDADLDALGQAAPGTRLRFRHAGPS